ncbi:glycoside hydrolase superfamily [Mycena capillaripes]|nr:glycoside hydrolase superfamily [Mycena capillaripes]
MRFLPALIAARPLVYPLTRLYPRYERRVLFLLRPMPDSVNVQLQDFTLNGNLFSGHIYIKNIAFEKVVNVFYSSATDFWPPNAADQGVSASFGSSISGTTSRRASKLLRQQWQQNYDAGVKTSTSASSSSTSASSSSTSTSSTTSISTTPPVSSSTPISSTTTTTSVLGDPTGIPADLPPCQTFTGDVHAPARSASWSQGFQDYRELTGYADFLYAADRKSAVVTVNAFSRTGSAVTYSFNGGAFGSANTASVSSAFTGAYVITWDAPAINRPETQNGQKVAIAELLAGRTLTSRRSVSSWVRRGGAARAHLAPIRAVFSDFWAQSGKGITHIRSPWWFVYQPVSYRLNSRHGTVTALRSMITTCRANGVRVYADAVVNHMNATSGSPYYTHTSTYQFNQQTGLKPGVRFPCGPYGPTDSTLNYGWLVGLADLNTEHTYVQERISAYFATLLIDAAKHMGPNNIAQILTRLKRKMGGSLPADFIIGSKYILIGGEKSLLACDSNDYNSICGSWILPPARFVIQNDDHDQQSPGSSSRDMQSAGSVLIKDKNVATHRAFEVQLFTRTDFPDAGPLVRNRLRGYTGTATCISMAKAPAFDANACGYSVVVNGAWTQGVYTRVLATCPFVTAAAAGLPAVCT